MRKKNSKTDRFITTPDDPKRNIKDIIKGAISDGTFVMPYIEPEQHQNAQPRVHDLVLYQNQSVFPYAICGRQLPPNAYILLTHVTAEQLLYQCTAELVQIGNEPLPCYILPYVPHGVGMLDLSKVDALKADVVVTTLLTGCTVVAEKDTSKPTLKHINLTVRSQDGINATLETQHLQFWYPDQNEADREVLTVQEPRFIVTPDDYGMLAEYNQHFGYIFPSVEYGKERGCSSFIAFKEQDGWHYQTQILIEQGFISETDDSSSLPDNKAGYVMQGKSYSPTEGEERGQYDMFRAGDMFRISPFPAYTFTVSRKRKRADNNTPHTDHKKMRATSQYSDLDRRRGIIETNFSLSLPPIQTFFSSWIDLSGPIITDNNTSASPAMISGLQTPTFQSSYAALTDRGVNSSAVSESNSQMSTTSRELNTPDFSFPEEHEHYYTYNNFSCFFQKAEKNNRNSEDNVAPNVRSGFAHLNRYFG